MLAADIVIFGRPTWLGRPSSVVKRVLERMDAMLSETGADGTRWRSTRPQDSSSSATRDGAHHCIAEMAGAAIDIGFTVPGQGWTYWNKGPGPGEEEYRTTDDRECRDRRLDGACADAHRTRARGDADPEAAERLTSA